MPAKPKPYRRSSAFPCVRVLPCPAIDQECRLFQRLNRAGKRPTRSLRELVLTATCGYSSSAIDDGRLQTVFGHSTSMSQQPQPTPSGRSEIGLQRQQRSGYLSLIDIGASRQERSLART
jgi:hypothetical protein